MKSHSTLCRWLFASLLTLLVSFPFKAIAATVVSDRPVLFVHGYSVFGFGENCKSDWNSMEAALQANGFTGTMQTIGYYGDDSDCDAMTSPQASILTPIESLSKDFAWHVYNQFSSQDVSVDIVTHSMGGLITRYAMYRVAVGDPDFPPFLKVSHVATLAGPFEGYSLLAESCHLVPVNVQCWEMFPLSSFIEGLTSPDALVPQGADGTTWSNVGSNAWIIEQSDGVVTSDSATSMNIPDSAKMVMPWYDFVFHTMYTHNNTVIANVVTHLSDGVVDSDSVITPAVAQAAVALPAAIPAVESRIAMAQKDVPLDVSNLSKDLKPGKAEPYFVGKEMQGVRISQILPGGMFTKMGIQEGDVIRGCTAQTRNAPFKELAQLETSSGPVTLDFCVLRNGVESRKQVVIQ